MRNSHCIPGCWHSTYSGKGIPSARRGGASRAPVSDNRPAELAPARWVPVAESEDHRGPASAPAWGPDRPRGQGGGPASAWESAAGLLLRAAGRIPAWVRRPVAAGGVTERSAGQRRSAGRRTVRRERTPGTPPPAAIARSKTRVDDIGSSKPLFVVLDLLAGVTEK